MSLALAVSTDPLTQAFNKADDAGPAPSHLHDQAGRRRGGVGRKGVGEVVVVLVVVVVVARSVQLSFSETNPVFPRSHSQPGR